MPKEILLVSRDPDDAGFCAQIAQNLGANLRVHPDPAEAAGYLVAGQPTAIFLDVSEIKTLRAFESEIQNSVGIFSDKVSVSRMNFISKKDLSETREAALSPLFGTFFKRMPNATPQSAEAFSRYIQSCENLSTHELSKFLKPDANIQRVELINTGQKQDAAEAVRRYLLAAKFPNRIAYLIVNAVDELLMNALYDAPVDEFGKPLYTMISRNQNRPLDQKSRITLTLGFDGEMIGISVTDHFGSVDRQKLLNHVSSNYNRRAYMVSATNAGAGLGVANVFRSGGSLIYVCEQRVRTEVTLLYRASINYREFKKQFRYFSAQFIV